MSKATKRPESVAAQTTGKVRNANPTKRATGTTLKRASGTSTNQVEVGRSRSAMQKGTVAFDEPGVKAKKRKGVVSTPGTTPPDEGRPRDSRNLEEPVRRLEKARTSKRASDDVRDGAKRNEGNTRQAKAKINGKGAGVPERSLKSKRIVREKQPNAAKAVKVADSSPDVILHKRMTKGKLALLSRAPLADVVPQEDKDAAAEELYGKGTKFRPEHVENIHDSLAEADIIPLDVDADPPLKKVKTGEAPEDPAIIKARRKEARKIKRQARKLRSQGELIDSEEAQEPGVVYLGHIPHGFYEKEMRGYFSQYGSVTRLRLSRSKRTAKSRGFAFIEFADKAVATAAAKSMDGYLMHGRALVAKLVPSENVHPDTFKGANKAFRKIPFSAIERRKVIQRSKEPTKLAERSRGIRKRFNNTSKKLSSAGIKYELPAVARIDA